MLSLGSAMTLSETGAARRTLLSVRRLHTTQRKICESIERIRSAEVRPPVCRAAWRAPNFFALCHRAARIRVQVTRPLRQRPMVRARRRKPYDTGTVKLRSLSMDAFEHQKRHKYLISI